MGAGHVCRGAMPSSRDDFLVRHPSTCTEDDDDAPPVSALVEDEVSAPSAVWSCPVGGLNQFAIMTLILDSVEDPPAERVGGTLQRTNARVVTQFPRAERGTAANTAPCMDAKRANGFGRVPRRSLQAHGRRTQRAPLTPCVRVHRALKPRK